jgi:hypothetical protein
LPRLAVISFKSNFAAVFIINTLLAYDGYTEAKAIGAT